MKNLLSIILSFLILIGSAPKSLVVGLFWVQQDVIAAEHCVNIAKPQLDCSGRCYLNAQLQNNQESSAKPNMPDLSELNETVKVFSNEGTNLNEQLQDLHTRPYSLESLFLDYLHSRGVWRPPIS